MCIKTLRKTGSANRTALRFLFFNQNLKVGCGVDRVDHNNTKILFLLLLLFSYSRRSTNDKKKMGGEKTVLAYTTFGIPVERDLILLKRKKKEINKGDISPLPYKAL